MNLIADIEVKGSRIKVVANKKFSEEFLREDFFIEFDLAEEASIIKDLDLMTVPFILNVAPIVWLSGYSFQVDEMDEVFAQSLNEIKSVYEGMYPDLKWDGSITGLKTSTGYKLGEESTVSLFSGGVDSVYTVLTSGVKGQTLATVRGSDIANDNSRGWGSVKRQTRSFSEAYGYKNAYIQSNFRSFLNVSELERRWPEITEGWWGGVQHGIGLLGLLAPIMQRGTINIAATHTRDFSVSWGSNPSLDTACRWRMVSVNHHGYDISRQGKLEKIVELTKDSKQKPTLRVCYSNQQGKGGNCVRCEKCLRTFAGLIVLGVDPGEYGLSVNRVTGEKRVISGFKHFRILLGKDEQYMWEDIQASARLADSSSIASDRFMRWLLSADFNHHQKRGRRLLSIKKGSIRFIRSKPQLEKVIKKLIAFKKDKVRVKS